MAYWKKLWNCKNTSSTPTLSPTEKPIHEYQEDEKDTILFGPYEAGKRGSRDFCSMKSPYHTGSAVRWKHMALEHIHRWK
ncbi:MAG: hypothetical protein ACLTRS_02610 [Lachnospiraceae bacterium]